MPKIWSSMIVLTLRLGVFVFLALALAPLARAQSGGETTNPETLALSSLPYQFVERFKKSEFNSAYKVGYQAVNPFYLTGDFDGDGQMDYVLRLVSKKDKDMEADAVFFAKGAPRLLSKDLTEGYPGPSWYIVSKNEKIDGADTSKAKGDAIMMVKPESSTAVVFWNGKSFEIAWLGG